MKKLHLLSLLFISANLLAQSSYFEPGIFGGVSNYYGDMTQDYVVLDESHIAYGGFLRYHIDPFKASIGAM